MARENAHPILLIAGDFDVIQQVQQALPPSRFLVQSAYNHREAFYAIQHSQFDALLVDVAMIDRHSGSRTIDALVQKGIRTPMVAVAADSEDAVHANRLADTIVTTLEQKSILNSVMEALELSPTETTRVMPIMHQPAEDDILSRRMDEIRTLFALSKSLAEVLDLTEVLNRVVEAARHLTNAEEGLILMPGEDGDLYLRAKVGIDVEIASNFRVKEKGTLPGEVFSTGQPVLIGASGPQKVKTEHLVNSLLYVPILVKGKPIGVLGVNNKTKKDLFDVHQQQLLINLSSFAAIAIENARIHQESLEHARELQTLVGASQVMNASLSMQEIVPTICLQLANVIDVGYTEILKLDKDGNRLTTLARYHRSIWRAGQAPVMELGRQPMLKATLENDRHRWLNRDDPVTSNEKMYLEQVGAAAMLMIPIRSDKQVLGALRCFFVHPPDEPPPADMIQRARNIGIECLVNLSNQNEQFHAADIYRLAAKINQMTEADWCDLSLLAKGGATLTIQARVGSGLWLEPPYSVLDLTQHQELLAAMQSQTLVYQGADNKITAAYKSLMDKAVSRSVIGVPLVQRGKVEGLILFADTERSRVFNEGETHLTQAIVGQAATALENSALVRDLGKSLRDLKDTQERLVQTARLSAMGELAAVVAHQINNPLTTIIVDTELMLMDEAPTSRNYSALTAIHRAGKRAANVARRLLAIARPHDPNAIPEMVDVVDTVRGILSLMQTHIERANIRIIANLPDDPLPAVLAIKGTLDDIWLNLLMNAHDALIGWEDGKIGIEVYFVPERKCINVVVWDNGPGIPENIRPQIFSPFFTTKPVGEGTGLGLHICREVVENVGGTINVESVPGHHTSFIVRLPVIAQNEVQ